MCRAIARIGSTRKKGGEVPPSETRSDEFLRASWRVMVAAEVDPRRLVFVDEMGVHTSLAPCTVTPTKASAWACRFRATLRQEHDAFGLDPPSWRDGRDDGRRGLHEPGSL